MSKAAAVAVLTLILSGVCAMLLFKIPEKPIWRALADISQLSSLAHHHLSRTGEAPLDLRALLGGEDLRDPWGRSYVYKRSESGGHVVYSVGRNGVDENQGGDDVTTKIKEYSCASYDVNCPMSLREVGQWIVLLLAIASSSVLVWLAGVWAFRLARGHGVA